MRGTQRENCRLFLGRHFDCLGTGACITDGVNNGFIPSRCSSASTLLLHMLAYLAWFTGKAKWSRAIMNINANISYTCAFLVMASQNVCCEKAFSKIVASSREAGGMNHELCVCGWGVINHL